MIFVYSIPEYPGWSNAKNIYLHGNKIKRPNVCWSKYSSPIWRIWNFWPYQYAVCTYWVSNTNCVANKMTAGHCDPQSYENSTVENSWKFKNTPPGPNPPRKYGLSRDYFVTMVANSKPLNQALFLGRGGIGPGTLRFP